MKQSNSNEWLLAALSQVEQSQESKDSSADVTHDDVTDNNRLRVTNFYIEQSSEDEKSSESGAEARNSRQSSTNMRGFSATKSQSALQLKSRSSDSSPAHPPAAVTPKRSLTDLRKPEIKILANHGELFSTEQASPDVQQQQQQPQHLTAGKISRNVSLFNLDMRERGDYILQAAKQIGLAQQCEANRNFRMAFNYYRNGVGILLTGVQRELLTRTLS